MAWFGTRNCQSARQLVPAAADVRPGAAVWISGATSAGSTTLKLKAGMSIPLSVAVGENYLVEGIEVVGCSALPAGATAWVLE